MSHRFDPNSAFAFCVLTVHWKELRDNRISGPAGIPLGQSQSILFGRLAVSIYVSFLRLSLVAAQQPERLHLFDDRGILRDASVDPVKCRIFDPYKGGGKQVYC